MNMVMIVVSRTHVHTFIWKCDLFDTRTKEIMAAASGSQRTLDGRVLNQAKRSRMSYTREYTSWIPPSLPRSSSCWSSTWFSRSRSSHLTVYFFSTFASLIPGPRPHRDQRSVVLALATITTQVGVVNTSISAYPILSAYFLTTYAYKRMRLKNRVYGMLF